LGCGALEVFALCGEEGFVRADEMAPGIERCACGIGGGCDPADRFDNDVRAACGEGGGVVSEQREGEAARRVFFWRAAGDAGDAEEFGEFEEEVEDASDRKSVV